MKFDARFKVVHVRWWHKPVPLYDKQNGEEHYRRVGWIWNQRAYLVNNLVEGWVAFVKDQTPENLECWFCTNCGTSMPLYHRTKIEEAIRART